MNSLVHTENVQSFKVKRHGLETDVQLLSQSPKCESILIRLRVQHAVRSSHARTQFTGLKISTMNRAHEDKIFFSLLLRIRCFFNVHVFVVDTLQQIKRLRSRNSISISKGL